MRDNTNFNLNRICLNIKIKLKQFTKKNLMRKKEGCSKAVLKKLIVSCVRTKPLTKNFRKLGTNDTFLIFLKNLITESLNQPKSFQNPPPLLKTSPLLSN